MFDTSNADRLYAVTGDFAPPIGEVENTENGFTYTAQEYRLVTVITPHASGVFRREDTFINTTDRPLTLYSALSRFTYAGGDFAVYTQRTEWTEESVGAWQPLHTAVSVQNDDLRLGCGAAPFIALFDEQKGGGFAYHLLADSLWQMKAARRFVVDGHEATVVAEMGISERGFRYTVAPGEAFALAPILFYDFESRLDMDAYKLHRYLNDLYPQKAMPIIYNTWMYRFGNLEMDELCVQLERAKELGVDYFVLDAGWFGRGWNHHPGFGTWLECEDTALCGKMTDFFARVRAAGLRPGVWFEIEGASKLSAVYQENQSLYFPEKGRVFVNFADGAAVEHLLRLVSDRITRYGIEFIKFDYNVVPDVDPDGASFVKYFKGYRTFLRRLRAAHPNVHIECCAGGGLRMALTNVGDFDSFWMSDNHSMHAQLDIFKNTLIRMPSRALEHWVTVEGVEHFRENFAGEHAPLLYSCGNATWSAANSIREDFLLSAMLGGPIGFSCDLTAIPKESFEKIKCAVAEYKKEKGFWLSSECHILADDERALVLQFNDAHFDTVKLFAFGRCKHQKATAVRPVLAEGVSYTDGAHTVGTTVSLSLDGDGSASTVTLKKEI